MAASSTEPLRHGCEYAAASMPWMARFMCHVSPSSTAVYLTITTELLECASDRFAHFAANSRKE
jgi:hypothetical protein